jgi:hypothetical protein
LRRAQPGERVGLKRKRKRVKRVGREGDIVGSGEEGGGSSE